MDFIITDEDILELEQTHGTSILYDERRKSILKCYDDVHACPGTGKTTLVASKLLLLAKKWDMSHSGICVLTHTNVAKEEIIERLTQHSDGFKLLKYPHFIGTIQDFVNTFLGLPYCRSNFSTINSVDDDICCEIIDKKLLPGTKNYLERKFKSPYELKYYFEGGKLELKIPGFDKVSTSGSYRNLIDCKDYLISNGHFFYSEMYAFAQLLITQNSSLKNSLRSRFQVIFIDEMQDAQHFQESLLHDIFGSDNKYMQKFGDPDQAIYSGMNTSGQPCTYNNSPLTPVTNSFRFGKDIAEKIKHLSICGKSHLQSEKVVDPPMPHTIFLYNDSTIQNVIEEFGKLVKQSFSDNTPIVARVLAGRVQDNPDSLTLKHYWPSFEKKSISTSTTPDALISSIKKSRSNISNSYISYEQIISSVLHLMVLLKVRTEGNRYYTKKTLINLLHSNEAYSSFRQLLTKWLMGDFPDENEWNNDTQLLLDLLQYKETLNSTAQEFLNYKNTPTSTNETPSNCDNNVYICEDGTKLLVSSIHGAKGETHDATLVLETKFSRYFDISGLIDHFIKNESKPVENLKSLGSKQTILASFLKKLYVACSRPKHLLCLASNIERIPQEKIEMLQKKGWDIRVLE